MLQKLHRELALTVAATKTSSKLMKCGIAGYLLEKTRLWQFNDTFIKEKRINHCKMTNHRIRATAIIILDNSKFEARHIMRVSGHKNESRIRSYAHHLPEKKTADVS